MLLCYDPPLYIKTGINIIFETLLLFSCEPFYVVHELGITNNHVHVFIHYIVQLTSEKYIYEYFRNMGRIMKTILTSTDNKPMNRSFSQ